MPILNLLEGKKTIGFAVVALLGALSLGDLVLPAEIGPVVDAFAVIIGFAGTVWGRIVARRNLRTGKKLR